MPAPSLSARTSASAVVNLFAYNGLVIGVWAASLAALKDRYLGRFELYHFLADEEQDVELFNGMLDQATCGEAIDVLVGDPGAVALFRLRLLD